ncbi:C39 family peptidase [Lactobacillaceae bacterium Melli_B3]
MSKRLKIFLTTIGLLIAGTIVYSSVIKAKSSYRITRVKRATKVVASKNSDIYNELNDEEQKVVGNTKQLVNEEVVVTAKATNHSQTFYKIERAGKVYGWVSADALKAPKEYVLPYTYTSQLYPTYAPSGCEAASLKIALSTKGLATNVSYKKFLDGIKRSSDYHEGYDANPYQKGAGAAISARGLAKYARKFGAKARDITGTNVGDIIEQVKQGNPVIFEGSWRMQNTRSNHIPVVVGYRSGELLVADPYMREKSKNKVFWVTRKQFEKIYNKREKLALVIE